jgi:hypothetical protein
MVQILPLTPLLLEADAGSVPCHFVSPLPDWSTLSEWKYHAQPGTRMYTQHRYAYGYFNVDEKLPQVRNALRNAAAYDAEQI